MKKFTYPIHHLGYACESIPEAIKYIQANYNVKQISEIIYDPLQDVTVCLIEIINSISIELVCGKTVKDILKKGISLYHICYEVDSIENTAALYKKSGAIEVSPLKPAKLFNGRLVTFLQTELGLIELLERSASDTASLIITASYTADPLVMPLKNLAHYLKIPLDIQLAPYNQIYQQLLDPRSLLYTSKNNVGIILLRFEDWIQHNHSLEFIKQNTYDLIKAIKEAITRGLQSILLFIDLNVKYDIEINKIVEILTNEFFNNPHIQIITSAEIEYYYPLQNYYDDTSNKLGHIPYTEEYFAILALMIIRKYHSLRQQPYKVIVIDCDDTLWDGVCGEEGYKGIKISPAHIALQKILLAQQKSGILLCLCSKNDENDVMAVFDNRPDMLLKKEHLADWRINWKKKSENILDLAQKLNLGIDSFIFIDNSQLECAEVNSVLPSVLTINLITEDEILTFVKHFWAFDYHGSTHEDQYRTQLYKENALRENFQKETKSLQEFIDGLNLKISITQIEMNQLDRLTQLMQRTNQFNMSTRRLSLIDLKKLIASSSICMVIDVADRFGNYGLVGVCIYNIDCSVLKVSDFLLSCRVLGRGVEHFVINQLGRIAQKNQINTINLIFIKTTKNQPIFNFLESLQVVKKNNSSNEIHYLLETKTAINLKYKDISKNILNLNNTSNLQINTRLPPSSNQIFLNALKNLSKNENIFKIAFQASSITLSSASALKNSIIINDEDLKKISEIWEQVLPYKLQSFEDNFFESGGGSLQAVKLISKIYNKFNIELTIRDIYDNPTLISLKNKIIQSQHSIHNNILSFIKKIDSRSNLPLSYQQEGLWFLDQLEGGAWFYNMPLALVLKGKLSTKRLEKAFQQILIRHESLRTIFTSELGKPQQVIIQPEKIAIKIEDVSLFTEDEIKKIATSEEQYRFDLSSFPLFRIRLLKRNKNEHIMLLTKHHIISDGWSYNVLFKELSAFYQGKKDTIPDLSIQYRDYSQWQRELVHLPVINHQLNYWLSKLNHLPDMPLLTDYMRKDKKNYHGDYIHFKLGTTLTHELKQLALKNNVSLYTILLTAFAILLTKYMLPCKEVVIATPVAGRRLEVIENLIGNFVNIVIIRTLVDDNPTFLDLLNRVKNIILEALTNQDVPFEMVYKNLNNQKKSPSSIQILFAFQDINLNYLNLPGIQVNSYYPGYHLARNELALELQELNNSIEGGFYFDISLFNRETINNFIESFQLLFQKIITNPAQKINNISLVSPDLTNEMIKFSRKDFSEKTTRPLHHFFERSAELYGNQIGLVQNDQAVSYSDINQHANQLAHYLVKNYAVGKDVLVGVGMQKSIDFIVSILAILKTGAAYLPLDYQAPKERLDYILADANPILILSSKETTKQYEGKNYSVIELASIQNFVQQESSLNLNRYVDVNSLAYVIYTSGSTGKPKGVMNTHINVTRLLAATEEIYHFSSQDIIPLFHSFAFDFSVWEMWIGFYYGGKLIIIDEVLARLPDQFFRCLQEKKITVLNQTPSAFKALIPYFNDDLKSIALRYIIFGGEKLNFSILTDWFEQYGDTIQLFNMYGITETTVHVTCKKVQRDDIKLGEISNIGQPIADLDILLLDKEMNMVPRGAPGEMYIGGPGLARGYLNKHELTAQRFIQHPFDKRLGYLYKSGDLARLRSNNEYEYLGRIDDQVQIRGYRVELGEIESVLNAFPLIANSAALIKEDNQKNNFLVAYVVLRCPTTNNLKISLYNKIIDHAKKSLPPYMLPHKIMFIDKIPLNLNGKINKEELLKLEIEDILETNSLANDFLDNVEAEISKVFTSLLNKPIHRLSHFFEEGGHSLLATQAVAKLSETFAINLPVRIIFENPVIYNLALHIKEKIYSSTTMINIPQITKTSLLEAPLSFFQQRLLILDKLNEKNAFYNTISAFEISGNLDINLLNLAWNELLLRHEILRTIFEIKNDGTIIQKIINPFLIKIPITYNRNDADDFFDKPFDLMKGPLFRFLLIILSEHQYQFLICIHHAIIDGYSLELLWKELSEIYNAHYQKQSLKLVTINFNYIDFTHWQKICFGQGLFSNQLEYWKNKLKDYNSILQLPSDKPRPLYQTFLGNTLHHTINKDIYLKLKNISVALNSSVYVILMAVYSVLLYRYSGMNDILIGSPVANRNWPSLGNIVGPLINTLVFRFNLYEKIIFKDLLFQVNEVILDALANQDIPFEQIVEALEDKRDLSRAPLFQHMLSYQKINNKVDLVATSVKKIPIFNKTAKFDLLINFEESDSQLTMMLEYNKNLFFDETAQRLLGNFLTLLNSIIENINQPIDSLKMLTQTEFLTIQSWNHTVKIFPDGCLHDKFEEKVKIIPNHKAVISARGECTYQQLSMLSDKIAASLIELEIQPGQLIAIVMEKGWEQVAAILSILKSGAAYLPISAKEPPLRLAALLAQGNVTTVLTQSDYQNLAWPSGTTILIINDINFWERFSSIKFYQQYRSDTLAYVIFTSGSTGIPKGVMINHNSALNTIQDINSRFNVTDHDVILNLSALNFDLSVYDILGGLAAGAKIVIPHEDLYKDPMTWFELLIRHKITIWNSVPALMQMLIDYIKVQAYSQQQLEQISKYLRLIMLSGDWIPLMLPKNIREIFPQVEIISLGGATEGSIWSIMYPIRKVSPDWNSIPYGKPLANQRFYVLNSALQPCPIGVMGELYIGGIGVSAGYWHDPIRTETSFIIHPDTQERLYRTGDLGKYATDGNIIFQGRIDHQVKIRGFRIELGEIEAKLIEFPGIKQALILVKEEQNNDQRLIAYYNSEKSLEQKNLYYHLLQHLPEYMIPSTYVYLPIFPISENGKIDKNKLPTLNLQTITHTDKDHQPHTALQEQILDIWAKILKVDPNRIGIKSNFFMLGGHSLLVIQIINELNKKFNKSISFREFFMHATIELLAQLMTFSDHPLPALIEGEI